MRVRLAAMLLALFAILTGAMGQDGDAKQPPICKQGTPAKVTGLVDQLETEDGQIAITQDAASACSAQSIDVKGKFPPECKDYVRVTASGKIRHEKYEDEIYYVLDEVKDLKCEDITAVTPAACTDGATVTTSATVNKVAPGQSQEGGTVVYLARTKAKEPCSFNYVHTLLPVPISCAPGSTVSAKGRVHASFDRDAALILVLKDIEDLKCTGAAATAASANAEKDCLEGNDYEKQPAACTELLLKDPKNATAYEKRAFAYYLRCKAETADQCKLAVADYTKAIEFSPGKVHLYSGRATAYRTLMQYDLAVADFGKMITLEPKSMGGYEERAEALIRKHDYKAAVADYSKLLEGQPGATDTYRARAWAYLQDGDYKSAAGDYAKVVALSPRDVGSARILAALKAFPATPDAMTECTADLSRARTLKACSDVIAKDPKSAQAYYHRAKAYDLENKVYNQEVNEERQNALQDFKKAIDLDPNQADFYTERGYVLGRMAGFVELALVDFAKAIELDPKKPEPYSALAQIYSNAQDYKTGVAYWTKAIEVDSKNADSLCSRGTAYYHLRDEARANADYKAADKLTGEEEFCD